MEPKKRKLKRVSPRSYKPPDYRAELVMECKDGIKTASLNSAMVEIFHHSFIDWRRALQSLNVQVIVDGKEWVNDAEDNQTN